MSKKDLLLVLGFFIPYLSDAVFLYGVMIDIVSKFVYSVYSFFVIVYVNVDIILYMKEVCSERKIDVFFIIELVTLIVFSTIVLL